MWNKASFLTRLVASSVRISEAAGATIKNVMTGGDLKIIDKSIEGEPADLQTEADRRAQYLIVKSLTERFGNINIIGEEDVTSECSGVVNSFAVDVLRLEDELSPDLKSVKPEDDVTSECAGVVNSFAVDVLRLEDELSSDLKSVKPEDVVVWVDPLDGTAEVALAIKNNNLTQPQRVVVTTRSHLSQSVTDALNALKEKGLVDVIEKYGGAGYKVIKVLEGSAAYVFASSGCKKWDTCAVEAVLCAAGGQLTDISGRLLCYESSVQRNNTGGVLASAPWVNHEEYIGSIPKVLKDQLPEIAAKS
ncbi:inositol monophosphatase family protein [Teladorsagia circumcincta]|uniref:3'(2'),5'-bisphosphate nucleotidase 1 n=1 Tax=Teladorsagia circumcincta TaxID=45464 RepID=A0A2G9UQ58_TELCI|nr:inositol monophosphatase family protein [Teladorsagia circumcincta]